MPKLTKEQFIERARAIHGDKYDYSKVEYVNARTKVCIICPEHGEFWQIINSHLNGRGCPVCGAESSHNPRKWTHEACYEEAKKYKSLIDLQKQSPSCYQSARLHNWLGEYSWLVRVKLENGYWNNSYEHCLEASKKFSSRSEFQKGNCGAYEASKRNGWIDSFTWLAGIPVDMEKNRIDNVYVYIFDDFKTVYIGRTINIRETIRRHRSASFNDVVFRFAKEHNIQVPQIRILESNLTILDGKEKEDLWKNIYLVQGYKILNIAKTGRYTGSSGNLGSVFTKERCSELAQQCRTITEYSLKFSRAYQISLKMGWLKDYIWFIQTQKPKGYWTKEKCFEAAQECKTIVEYQKLYRTAYKIACKNGWIDDWFTRQLKPNGYWDKDRCFKAAKKCSSQKEYLERYPTAHKRSMKNKWMSEYTWFERTKKPFGYWKNKEHCELEAQKYKTIKEFQKANSSACEAARKYGWLNEWFVKQKHEKNYWTKEHCKEVAIECKSRREFQIKHGSAYVSSRIHKWLDEFFPKTN